MPAKQRRQGATGTRLYWEYAALTIPAFVDPALDDIDVNDPKARQAARHFALAHLTKVEKALGPMTKEELQQGLAYFIERYQRRLKHHREQA